MRKRAQRKTISMESSEKTVDKTPQKKPTLPKINKKMWIAISLVAIFLLVLFLNTYFNVASGQTYNPDGEGIGKYYLSGPDPYYNMRLVEQTMYGENPGEYPFYSDTDPLLNYPIETSGGRKPLMNMMAIMVSQVLTPFMDEIDALGLAMQLIPALFGALLVFPVYFLGKELFNKKIGLLAAFLIALIPVHLGSGHGSAFALFDHDSFNLFMIITTYLFLVKGIRESDKIKSMVYAALGGITLGGLQMVWVEAEFLFTVIAVYAFVQMIVDIFTNKSHVRIPRTFTILLFTGYLVSLPVVMARMSPINLELFICLGVAFFGTLYYLFDKKNIPWTLSLPSVFVLGVGGLIAIYLTPLLSESIPMLKPLTRINSIIYGSGIYGNKVSDTIAEAGTYGMSRTVMSFGPALFWLAWAGFFLIAINYLRKEHRKDHLFILVLFLIQIWFIFVAGRFINDLVVPVALLGAWMIWFTIDKIDYSTLVRSIRAAGGGIHGLRRGVKFLHVFGILFVALLVILPNAYLSLDAAVPAGEKQNVFGDLPNGAFGGGIGKETYWVHAYEWLATQDTSIENPKDRPAYISWWDYGFYGSAISGHPMVADNFQDGIPTAANFHTSTSEKEAVSVWIVRVLEGHVREQGSVQSAVRTSLEAHINGNDTDDVVQWIESPASSPSYGMPIAEPLSDDVENPYVVGQQWSENAAYHDIVDLLMDYDEDTITMLYRDLQQTTGYCIRYYGVETYDKDIFNIFGYLADKSLLLPALQGIGDFAPEDEFVEIKYITQSNQELSYQQVIDRSDEQNRNDPLVNTRSVLKDAYFDTMFYRTYIGINQTNEDGSKSEPSYQLPCTDMKHFYAQYISPYPEYAVSQGKSAVVIAKYYEGAEINGTITFDGENKDLSVIAQQNITHYGTELPVDHDTDVAVNGSYSVLLPAGESQLQIRRYPELGMNALTIQNVTFSASDPDSLYALITEDEATRNGDYQRTVDIAITPGELSGTIYRDLDGLEGFNTSDEPLSNIEVNIYGINTLDPQTGQPTSYDFTMTKTITTDSNGYYNTSGLFPGYYQVVVLNEDEFQIENILIPIIGETTHDVVEPKPGDIEGTIFFDTDGDTTYDVGEEMMGVTVDLVYTMTGDDTIVSSLTTTSDGSYQFTDLIPGVYSLHLTQLPDYDSTTSITITEGETTTLNASIAYALIDVSGTTKNDVTMSTVANMTISFTPTTTIENNTAKEGVATSDTNGAYQVSLMPGTYNVTVVERVVENNVNVTYSCDQLLVLPVGQGSKTFDVLLAREIE